MKIDITWEMKDKIILAGLIDSIKMLSVEIKELKEKEHLMEHEIKDLHDARKWIKHLKKTYSYFSFDISALDKFTE